MDNIDLIKTLAQSEARKASLVKVYDRDDTSDGFDDFPVLCIRKTQMGKYHAYGRGHDGHDNQSRMDVMTTFITKFVLPNVDKEANLCGDYRIELHDTLSREFPKDEGCLCFARSRDERKGYMLIPDEYQVLEYGGLLSNPVLQDPFDSWEKKRNHRAFFCGTTTGNRDPLLNERLQACDWVARHARSHADFYITKIAQMSEEDVLNAYPTTAAHFLKPQFIPVSTQYDYRYLVNIAGNTCCWDRVPMILNSRSLMVNLYHKDMLWYYPALKEREHYVCTYLSHLNTTMAFYDANPRESNTIVRNANRFVQQFLGFPSTVLYTTMLMEDIAYYCS